MAQEEEEESLKRIVCQWQMKKVTRKCDISSIDYCDQTTIGFSVFGLCFLHDLTEEEMEESTANTTVNKMNFCYLNPFSFVQLKA